MTVLWQVVAALLLLQVEQAAAVTGEPQPITSLKFGGAGGFVKFFPNIIPVQNVLTVCGWVKKEHPGANRTWISYNYEDKLNYEVTVSDLNETNFIDINYIEGEYLGVNTTVGIPLNAWTHLCQSWSLASATVRTYANGTLVQSKSGTPPFPLNEGGYILIGHKSGQLSEPEQFWGEMTKLNVFGKELTAAEVAEMYHSGMCSEIEQKHQGVRFIRWENMLSQPRAGDVTEVERCNAGECLCRIGPSFFT